MKMMKRPYPFEQDLSRQLKVHVGQKEVNGGVCKNKQMQNVYDKTMSLLKEGAKSLAINTSSDNLLDISNSCMQCSKVDAKKFKQTFLSNNLQLETSGKESQKAPITLCGCCRIIDSQSNCQRCDQILCTFCLLDCADCSGTFCQNCSLQMYDFAERSLCLDCYR